MIVDSNLTDLAARRAPAAPTRPELVALQQRVTTLENLLATAVVGACVDCRETKVLYGMGLCWPCAVATDE